MYRSILVPLDGSPFGEHALPWALRVARQTGAALRLVHAHATPVGSYGETGALYDNVVEEFTRRRELAYLRQIQRRVAEQVAGPVTEVLVEGPVGDGLVAEARTAGADLVIMTTHGRGPLARAWLGSVADELVRRLSVPVLLVRPHDVRPDLTQDPQVRHILVLLDGSPLAEQILVPAVDFASLTGADISLLRVVRPLVLGGDIDTLPPEMDETMLRQLRTLHQEEQAEAQRYLERIAGRLRDHGLRVIPHVAMHDQPAVAALDEIKRHAIDLVALATHGRSGLPRLFLGSVADKILRGTSVPVLVHRPAH
jgi:nucleotide-binding universal stress UspA family protein